MKVTLEKLHQKLMPYGYGLIAGVLIILAVGGGLIFSASNSDKNMKVEDVIVTNLTDTAFTVIWRSEEKSPGSVVFQEADKDWTAVFSQYGREKAYDDRDVEINEDGDYVLKTDGLQERYTHHVTVRNLKPDTEYEFRIKGKINGKSVDILNPKTTKIEESLKTPDPGYGKVQNVDNNDSMLYFYVVEADVYRPASTVVSDNGTYTLDINYFDLEKFTADQLRVSLLNKNDNIKTLVFPTKEYKPFGDFVLDEALTPPQGKTLNNSLFSPVSAQEGTGPHQAGLPEGYCDDGIAPGQGGFGCSNPTAWTGGSGHCNKCVNDPSEGQRLHCGPCTDGEVSSIPTSLNPTPGAIDPETDPKGPTAEDITALVGTSCRSPYNDDGVRIGDTFQGCTTSGHWTGGSGNCNRCLADGSTGQRVSCGRCPSGDTYATFTLDPTATDPTGFIVNESVTEPENPTTIPAPGDAPLCTNNQPPAGSVAAAGGRTSSGGFDSDGAIYEYQNMICAVNTGGNYYVYYSYCPNGLTLTKETDPVTGIDRYTCYAQVGATIGELGGGELQPGTYASRVIVPDYFGDGQDGVESCGSPSTVPDDAKISLESGNTYYISRRDSMIYYNSPTCQPIPPGFQEKTGSGRNPLENNLLGVVSAQATDKLTVENSGNYVFYSDGQRIGEKTIRTKGNEIEVKIYEDTNKNGKKDGSEEYISDYSSISYSTDRSIEDYSLSSGWSLINLPLVSTSKEDPIRTASDLIDYWNGQGAEIVHVARYRDGDFQIFTKREDETTYANDFDLIPGEALFIFNLGNSIDVEFEGNAFTESVPIDLVNGWNLVGFVSPDKTYTSESLLNKIKDSGFAPDTISSYDSGLYESVVLSDDTFYGSHFNITPKNGYFVKIQSGGGQQFTP